MHICYLCNEYPPGQHGGIGTLTQVLGRSLVARGHTVSAVGFYPIVRDCVEDDCGVRVIRLAHAPIPGTGLFVHGFRLRQLLTEIDRQQPIDIIEGPELSLAMLPQSTHARKTIRMHGGHHFFATTLGAEPKRWRAWLEARSFKRADALCAVSNFVAEKTRELLCLGDRPIEILPNPVETDLFSARPDIPEDSGLILFVGTVCEKKGIRQLVQAMPQIMRAVPDARLLAVGRDWKDSSGQSFTDMLRSTMTPEVARRVNFLGAVPRPELPALMARATVCVYPSHMEAMGLTLVEALSMEKPVVASKLGPGPEVVEDERSGLLCDPYDPSSIANAVARLLRDEELRQRLGRTARARAVEQFSISAIVRRNETFYAKCLEMRRAS